MYDITYSKDRLDLTRYKNPLRIPGSTILEDVNYNFRAERTYSIVVRN